MHVLVAKLHDVNHRVVGVYRHAAPSTSDGVASRTGSSLRAGAYSDTADAEVIDKLQKALKAANGRIASLERAQQVAARRQRVAQAGAALHGSSSAANGPAWQHHPIDEYADASTHNRYAKSYVENRSFGGDYRASEAPAQYSRVSSTNATRKDSRRRAASASPGRCRRFPEGAETQGVSRSSGSAGAAASSPGHPGGSSVLAFPRPSDRTSALSRASLVEVHKPVFVGDKVLRFQGLGATHAATATRSTGTAVIDIAQSGPAPTAPPSPPSPALAGSRRFGEGSGASSSQQQARRAAQSLTHRY